MVVGWAWWWPVKFVVQQKMDWQMRWSLLTFLGGWDDKQDRKMCVKVIIILALMMTKYLAAPSRITQLRQLPFVAAVTEFTSQSPQLQSISQDQSACDPACSSDACLQFAFWRTAKCWVWKADVMMSVILIVCSEFEIVNYRRVMNINTKLNSTHRHGCQSQNCWL